MLLAGLLSGLQVALWRVLARQVGTPVSLLLSVVFQLLFLTAFLLVAKPSALQFWRTPALGLGVVVGLVGIVFLGVMYWAMARAVNPAVAFALFSLVQMPAVAVFTQSWPSSPAAYGGMVLVVAGLVLWQVAG